MEIKVLGPGCVNCARLEANVKKVIEELGLDAEVEKVEDVVEIMSYGIMSTPGLVVDGQVKVAGRVPTSEEIKAILKG